MVSQSSKIPPHVDVHDLVVLSKVGCLNAAHGQDPGAVDQHVQPAIVSQGFIHCLLHRLLIGQITRHQQRLRNKEGGKPAETFYSKHPSEQLNHPQLARFIMQRLYYSLHNESLGICTQFKENLAMMSDFVHPFPLFFPQMDVEK